MIRPQRIRLNRGRGFNVSQHSRSINGLPVKLVDRRTRWGNPYVIGEPVDLAVAALWGFHLKHTDYQAVDRLDAVQRFAQLLAFDSAAVVAVRRELSGRNLACWCPIDEPCHADVLLAIANGWDAPPYKKDSKSTGEVS